MILIAVTYTRKLESWLKMGLNRAIFITMIYVFLGLNVCACKPQAINVDVVDIYLGMSAKEFSALPYSYVEKQPMGVNFYDTNWHSIYTIHFKHSKYGFDIPRMASLTGYESTREPERQISSLWGDFLLSDTGPIGHQAAKDEFFGFVNTLKKRGWRQYYHLSSARYKGEVTWQTYLDKYGYPENIARWQDANYVPTLKEWMDKDRITILLYADEVLLTLSVNRDPNLMDLEQNGDYFVSIKIDEYSTILKQGLVSEKRSEDYYIKNWPLLLPETLMVAQNYRLEDEAEAKQKNYAIDEDYEDPALPDRWTTLFVPKPL